MANQIESALVIELSQTIPWNAAVASVSSSGSLVQIDPGQPLNILEYTLRDRQFQHRDMIIATAVAKVSIHAQTVWNGTVLAPRLQGSTGVTDSSGTNIFLGLDPRELPAALPLSSTSVYYVGSENIAYDAIRVTDPGLYSRDLLLYETLARAAAVFPAPPIQDIDPGGAVVSATSIWATAQGTSSTSLPNAALPLSPPLFTAADQNLANTDNQVAAYVARVVQVLKNPFAFATRIYVAIAGAGARESETYVLTDNAYLYGQTYGAGDEVLYLGSWYRANYSTADTPPSPAWVAISGPNLCQFLADPSLSGRNKIVYNIALQTLQWFLEDPDTFHVPQIVGLYVPGILPGQAIETVALVPEPKDAQFWRQKAARVCLGNGSWATVADIYPTGGPATTTGSGGLNVLFQSAKALALLAPGSTTISFTDIVCEPGSYALTALVKPASGFTIAGSDLVGALSNWLPNAGEFSGLGATLSLHHLTLPPGPWSLYLNFGNDVAAANPATAFGLQVTLGGQALLASTNPLAYTDSTGAPLPNGTTVASPALSILADGNSHTLSIQWVTGAGALYLQSLAFLSTANQTSHYVMAAAWPGQGTATLDVIGQAGVSSIMPFPFYAGSTVADPQFNLAWNQPDFATFDYTITYYVGATVLWGGIYWQANTTVPAAASLATAAVPGISPAWTQLAPEPQLPLLVENIHLQQWQETTPTPMITGFAGFRQDMLERAERSVQDSYAAVITAVGTGNLPEFRVGGTSWDYTSTGSWLAFQESYHPRLCQIPNVPSGLLVAGRQYQVAGNPIIYNSATLPVGAVFYGVSGQTTFSGAGQINQVGAYKQSLPGDVGNATALVPDGLEFVISAGTVAAWLAADQSIPRHTALLPWMVEAGIFVAQDDFSSPKTM
jgi:hypothetical protein